jgi:predicted permease
VALGASRGRLLRQTITESLLLASLGCLAALLLAAWATEALGHVNFAVDAPIYAEFPLDLRVFLFTLVVATLAGVLAGLVPALKNLRVRPAAALKQGERTVTSGTRARLRALLVAMQVAAAVVVLVSAALVARSVRGASNVDLGFDSRNQLTFSVDLGNRRYSGEQRQRFYENVLARIRSTPGVTHASLARTIPFGFNNMTSDVFSEDATDDAARSFIFYNIVSGDYFRTMRIPLRRGRDFGASDHEGAAHVAIVNEPMARTLWPNAGALGRRFRLGSDGPLVEIVGVVASSRTQSLREPPRPFFYLPVTQNGIGVTTFHVRTAGEPASLAPAMRQIVRAFDSDLPIFDMREMAEHLENGRAIGFLRIGGWIAGVFALLAIAIATVGVYGVIAYTTGQRLREIALRMALGARATDIRRLVLREALTIAGIGAAVGLAAAFAFTRLLSTMLHGVSATDPASFLGTAALVIALALVASLAPLRKALRVQPITALNAE